MKTKFNNYAKYRMAILLLLASGLGYAYADNGEESACKEIDSNAARLIPNFLAGGPIGCDALQSNPPEISLFQYCQNEKVEYQEPNCSVTHYGWDSLSSPPDTVAQCSLDGAVRFKYVLCRSYNSYKWKLIFKDTINQIPDSIEQKDDF